MCGIAGISVAAGDTKINTRVVASSLLLAIETRGRDATGAAWLNADGDTVDLTKVPVTATSFLKHRTEHLPTTTATMILHTRTGTHGSSQNRLNLHPVVHERIIGVHNGVLRNHGKLFTNSKRKPTAQVDSEGLMAILNTDEHPTEVLGQIEGDAAIAWMDLDEPEVLHLACVTGRPLCIGQTEEGSLIFASTVNAIRDAARAGGLKLAYEETVKEETYMRVVAGVIVECLVIKGVKHSDKAFRDKYAYTSGTGATKGTGYKPNAAKAPGAAAKPAAGRTAPGKVTPKALPAKPTTTAYEDDLAAARRRASEIVKAENLAACTPEFSGTPAPACVS